jgi:hypothetical protein
MVTTAEARVQVVSAVLPVERKQAIDHSDIKTIHHMEDGSEIEMVEVEVTDILLAAETVVSAEEARRPASITTILAEGHRLAGMDDMMIGGDHQIGIVVVEVLHAREALTADPTPKADQGTKEGGIGVEKMTYEIAKTETDAPAMAARDESVLEVIIVTETVGDTANAIAVHGIEEILTSLFRITQMTCHRLLTPAVLRRHRLLRATV